MQKLLDDIRTEMETLKGCVGRMEQRLDELQGKLAELSELLQAGSRTQTPEPLKPEEPVAPAPPMQPSVRPVEPQTEASKPAEQPAEDGVAASSILGERIRPAADLRHALSLNDSFRFTRELFGGDGARMNRVLARLGEAGSFAEALSMFGQEVHVAEDNEAAADFVELLRKYFN